MGRHLTSAQVKALKEYAEKHGWRWKSRLQSDWLYARVEGELQQIRNQFGPSWLVNFKLPRR